MSDFQLIFSQHQMNKTSFTLNFVYNLMKARYAGKCHSCGDDIKIGKEIAKNSDDIWVHKHCVEELVDLP